MFTGIVEGTGSVVDVSVAAGERRLHVATPVVDELERGQSVAVSGVCLTVENTNDGAFEVFVSGETVERTYLDEIGVGDRLNLERALPAAGRFDGHIVQGHVDGTAEVVGNDREDDGEWTFTFSLPPDLGRYVVEKGSIAVDGISLTVATLHDDAFSVAIVPETYDLTTLSEKEVGDPVHLEVDVVAKYVERLMEGYRG